MDLSADFRYPSSADYEAVYGSRTARRSGCPSSSAPCPSTPARRRPRHIGHPGCFTTAVALAAVPLVELGLVEPRLQVVAVTGTPAPAARRRRPPTTPSGAATSSPTARSPTATSRRCGGWSRDATGVDAAIHFVPQSGPFARGIYATLHARLPEPRDAAEVRAALADFYAGAPFVEVVAEPPRLQDVVGTNRCRLGGRGPTGDALVAFSALDNLVKGAAGGGIQWMNRLLGLDETTGLVRPGLGWI